MTLDETLQTIATNQAKHSADIVEIDRMIAANVESLNRHDRQLDRLFEVVGDLADKQARTEEILAGLAASRERHDARMAHLEATYELFESFVKDFREETHDHFAATDRRLEALAGAQVRTDEQIRALVAAQARTDEQIQHLLTRNGSSKKAKKAVKKPKKGSAK